MRRAAIAFVLFATACNPTSGTDAGPSSGDASTSGQDAGHAKDGPAATDGPSGTLCHPTVLVPAGQTAAAHLVADANNLYFTDESANVFAVPKAGGALVTVNTAPLDTPFGLAIDGATLFVTVEGNTHALVSLPAAGGASTTLAGLPFDPADYPAAGGGRAYFSGTAFSGGMFVGQVNAVPEGGGSATTLATAPGTAGVPEPPFLAYDGGTLFWLVAPPGMQGQMAPAGSLVSLDTTTPNATPVTLATVQQPANTLAVDATRVYFSDTSGIGSVPRAGGAVTRVLAADPHRLVQQVASDPSTGMIYFADDTGIGKVPAAGGTAVPVCTGFSATPLTAIYQLVVDADRVYWADPHRGAPTVLSAPK